MGRVRSATHRTGTLPQRPGTPGQRRGPRNGAGYSQQLSYLVAALVRFISVEQRPDRE